MMNKESKMINVRNDLVGFCLMSIFLLVAITSLSGCSQAPVIPKEGDEVVWRQSSELIIKAKLGQRREHVIVDARTDHKFYEPEYERFIGQFSIDYDPKPFPKLTEQERIVFEAEYSSKIHAVKSIHPIQFNLMLNGIKAKATDRSIYSEQALDDINQVKVELGGLGILTDINYTTKDVYERFLKSKEGRYDEQSSDQYGLDCYYQTRISGLWCFGQSSYSQVSGYSFTFMNANKILVSSRNPLYGGIKVTWVIDRAILQYWKMIDVAIWRLLETWNVSSLGTNKLTTNKLTTKKI
jgi:hypothetical protein